MNTKWRNEVGCAFVLTFDSIELVSSAYRLYLPAQSVATEAEQVRRQYITIQYTVYKAYIFYNKRNQLIRVNKLFFISFCIFMCSMLFFLFLTTISFAYIFHAFACAWCMRGVSFFFVVVVVVTIVPAFALSTSSMAIKINWLGTVHIST